MPKSKSKKFLNIVTYGLFSDKFCENDFSIHTDTFNRGFKQATMNNTIRVSPQLRKEYKKHGIIDN